MTQFQWEQRGGRVKLVEAPSLVIIPEDSEAEKKRSLRLREAQEHQRRKQAREEQRWRMVQQFLEKHNYSRDNVNAPKHSWWGFKWSYPLHTAVMEETSKWSVC
eukprot:Skav201746  [mRNA]  locus=scaffold1442:70085:77476:+ [translate_table: standard]